MMLEKEMEQSVVAALSWFDIFDYPATAEEIHKHLWGFDMELSFDGFSTFLERLVEKGVLSEQDGYYFFAERRGLVEKRNENIALVEQKLKVAKRAVQKIYWLPFVQAVFLCNTVAFGWPKDSSDVDFFIVVRRGRIWMTRIFVTLMLSLFGLRRNKKQAADKVCLSFYITDESFDLEHIQITKPDVYLVYWIQSLLPLYDPDDVLKKINEHNLWVYEYVHDFSRSQALPRYSAEEHVFPLWLKRMFEAVWKGSYGDMIEKQARMIQKNKMKSNAESVQNENDTRVVVSDTMLKFHENDRRLFYKKMWVQRCKAVLGRAA